MTKSIEARVSEIQDRVGWSDSPDLAQAFIDLCREVAILAHQVDAILYAQDALRVAIAKAEGGQS